ncbi:hypothetical protein HOT49_gp253 [Erwinia phage vB_EamM_Alexandra]|uniref:Uncharacterized protein n=1 Tax=Erwinia phage vB_EamM_Alexandra TaxID=2201424 RepID=A0A2Z4QE09_9CAUD|nr:hypothetical protein HOT49_gp253 [Erwinia phage vB_EamM_Alexandra]AWY08512.1 hypothetical protein Alexandra_255 [Erwinia phage vB_EamM_Alexandra]
MKAANFDKAFNAKDEATLNAYAAQITSALNALGRYDLKFEIIFGTDPYGERPDFVNDPNGFCVYQNGIDVFDIYTPTEKQMEGDASDAFIYSRLVGATQDVLWGKVVSDNDVAEIAEHLNDSLPRVGRIFNESDRTMLQQIADDLNAQLVRGDAKVIVTEIDTNERRLMFVGWDLEADECTDEYGYFIDLPYTDVTGEDANYSITYAGYPHPEHDYSFSSADLAALAPELEQLDVA